MPLKCRLSRDPAAATMNNTPNPTPPPSTKATNPSEAQSKPTRKTNNLDTKKRKNHREGSKHFFRINRETNKVRRKIIIGWWIIFRGMCRFNTTLRENTVAMIKMLTRKTLE